MKTVIVLGAGMVGVGAALHLRERGHDVLLLDRRTPGCETSYGNAGIIQREAVEPYAFPHRLADLLRYALRLGPAVSYHLADLPQLLPRLAAYRRASDAGCYAPIAQAWASLIAHSLSEHAPLVAQAGADDLVSRAGFRCAYRHAATYAQAVSDAARLADAYGVRFTALEGPELARAEPILRQPFQGAVHWLDPWSVRNPGELVVRYARLFERRGGRVSTGDAATLRQAGAGWRVDTADGPASGSDVVVALGPWSDDLLRSLGYRLPLFVKRGYHRHYRPSGTLNLPLLCADDGVMLSPMTMGLRVATGIELARRDAPATPVQLVKAEARVRQWMSLGEPVERAPWKGARPCTVDMKPVIGPAPRHRGLWFDFGHAHQGFTLGPASGRLIADLVEGKTPYVDAGPFAATRFVCS